jgi:hypothetical protein
MVIVEMRSKNYSLFCEATVGILPVLLFREIKLFIVSSEQRNKLFYWKPCLNLLIFYICTPRHFVPRASTKSSRPRSPAEIIHNVTLYSKNPPKQDTNYGSFRVGRFVGGRLKVSIEYNSLPLARPGKASTVQYNLLQVRSSLTVYPVWASLGSLTFKRR